MSIYESTAYLLRLAAADAYNLAAAAYYHACDAPTTETGWVARVDDARILRERAAEAFNEADEIWQRMKEANDGH